MEVLPAIIAESKEELARKLALVRREADCVQIDVMDGDFVLPKTWPYTDGAPGDLKELKGDLRVEAHLMISKPERVIGQWVNSGVDRMLIHEESTRELGVIIDALQTAGIEWGIVLKLETPIQVLDQWASECDFVQLMGIGEIGYHGRPFDSTVIPKAHALRLKYPELRIEVDGGVTLENALRLKEVGVNAVAVGGAIFNAPEPLAALREFKETL